MSFEIIPQAPRYEMNQHGVLRNRETGKTLKWSLSPRGTKTAMLCWHGKRMTVTQPHLLWQLHGKIVSKKRPVPVVISKGTRSMRFDSLKQCALYLEKYHGKKLSSCQAGLARRQKHVGGWSVHYWLLRCTDNENHWWFQGRD